jgi:hypothetical protein
VKVTETSNETKQLARARRPAAGSAGGAGPNENAMRRKDYNPFVEVEKVLMAIREAIAALD